MAREFTELAAWQLADELRSLVLAVLARPTVARDFRFCDQCKDSARSVCSNIAEGFGRYQHKDFARFLRIAVGSLNETRNHLIDGHRSGYLTADELERATGLIRRCSAACSALIRYLKSTPDPP
jgi:four helix bundle protein